MFPHAAVHLVEHILRCAFGCQIKEISNGLPFGRRGASEAQFAFLSRRSAVGCLRILDDQCVGGQCC
jgi:hypothetical protein